MLKSLADRLSKFLRKLHSLSLKRLKIFYFNRFLHLINTSCRIKQEALIVGSYPKSGRTWLRFFLANYISHLYKLNTTIDWNNFHKLTPSPLCKKEEGLPQFPKQVEQVIFSHNFYLARYFRNRKVVFITRNFKDILVSYYYFHKYRNLNTIKSLSLNDFVLSAFNFSKAIKKINLFSNKLESARETLIIPYESLKENPTELFKRLIDFSPYDFQKESFDYAFKHSTFEYMHNLEKKNKNYLKKEAFHTRKGEPGESREKLSTKTKKFVNDKLESGLTGILKDYYI